MDPDKKRAPGLSGTGAALDEHTDSNTTGANGKAHHITRPGISAETLAAAGIYSDTDPEPGSIGIPYYDRDGNPTGFQRWRLPKVRPDGQKYHQLPKSGLHVYLPSRALTWQETGGDLVLVEGEFKCLALIESGIHAIGLPGLNTYTIGPDEKPKLLAGIAEAVERWKPDRVLFLGDADTATNYEFARNAAYLAGALTIPVILPRIPLGALGKGVDDVRDVLSDDFPGFWKEIVEKAEPIERKDKPGQIAVRLLKREVDHLRALTGAGRDRSIDRVVKMIALCGDDVAKGALIELASDVFDIGRNDLKRAAAADRKERTEDAPQHPKSAAADLVEMASGMEFFHDKQGRGFARIQINGHVETWAVASRQFKVLLQHMFYKARSRTIRRESLVEAVAEMEGRAMFEAPMLTPAIRVASHGDGILIDLGDTDWRAVEVTAHGWRIVSEPGVPFVRTSAMGALPLPITGGSIDPLWTLLNVAESQRPLVAGALLNYFHPCGPYFVTNLVGEQGTAKSSAAKILRQLVDPSENPLRSPPKEERDLLAQGASNWIVALDNLSKLPDWLSDALCRLSTGGGHSARGLFTDLDEVTIAIKRPVILNGIEDVASRPDLAERALQIELDTIPEDRRITEKVLWQRFHAAAPEIFGALLDGLSAALLNLPNVVLDGLPRMADAAIWATAGESSFGWERGTFMSTYTRNLAEGAQASVESHPVGVVIGVMLDDLGEWKGEPSDLLHALAGIATDDQKKSDRWPKDVRSLGHCLRRLAQALRRAGIAYERSRGSRARTIILSKTKNTAPPDNPGKTSSTSSQTSSAPEKSRPGDDDDNDDVLFPDLREPAGNEILTADGKEWSPV